MRVGKIIRGSMWLAVAVAAAAMVPTAATAQDAPAGPRRQAAVVGGGDLTGYVAALAKLDLPADKREKVDAIVRKAQQEVRAARQDLVAAEPAERREKMRAITKLATDAKAKVEAELTPEQNGMLAKAVSVALVDRVGKMLVAERKAAEALPDLDEDKKKQITAAFDEAAKAIDGSKADAAAVTDAAGAKALQEKLTTATTDVTRAVFQAAGRVGVQAVLQAGMRATATGAAGGTRRRPTPTTGPVD